MRISDWSSDVCSSDLGDADGFGEAGIALAHLFVIHPAATRAAREAGHGETHALHMRTDAFDAPIAAAREHGGFELSGRGERKRVGKGKGLTGRVSRGGCDFTQKKIILKINKQN